MTQTETLPIVPLADLFDARQDLREILARNLNLAHACLLLRRGESEAVVRALDLALRQTDSDTQILAECIQIELLRLAGEPAEALAKAEALALRERNHPAAVLVLRNLFPLVDPSRPHHPPSIAASVSSPDSVSVGDARDSQVMDIRPETAPEHEAVPAPWAAVANDPTVTLLRIHRDGQINEVRREDVAVGVLEETVLQKSAKILAGLGFGTLQHSSFEGDRKIVHSWYGPGRAVVAIFGAGGSASLLGARCTKAFQDFS